MENSNNNESVRFNKRRAEGRDKDEKPKKKTMHLRDHELNPCNTVSYVQILGNGMDTQDTSPSVLLFFDNQRFLFNAGEGLQRYCIEHKIKLSKIDRIFLSRVCSETVGGLPGLLLTLAGIGEGMTVNVCGPPGLKYLVGALSSLIKNSAIDHIKNFGPSPGSDVTAMLEQSNFTNPIVLVDNKLVKISAILLQPSFSEGSRLFNEVPTKENALQNVLEERTNDVSEPYSPNSKVAPAGRPGDISVVYICELTEIKGKFHPEKAAAFGIQPGPKYGQLQKGHSVKSDRQDVMVHPSDVMDPSVPGPIVLLVDCPTESHLQQLLSIEYLNSYFTDFSGPAENSKVVTCVIHLSPASVVSSPNYRKWMKRFGSAQHIMAGHERKNMEIPILKSSARIAARLNSLCPQFFPAPGFWSLQDLGCSASNSIVSSEDSDSKLCESIAAENLLKFTLRPFEKLGLDRSCIPSSMDADIPDFENTVQCVNRSTGEISSPQDITGMIEEPWLIEKTLPGCLENIKEKDLEIVLLGTGSSQPSKYRNVSSIHINLFSKGSLLLDCGEGTLGQLKRRYGVDNADNIVRGLRCIWISHIHADHHTGLARILALRRDLLKEEPHEPVLVIGPRMLNQYLDAYQQLEDLDMVFLDCSLTTESSLNTFEGFIESNNGHFSTNPINSDDNGNKPLNGRVAQKIDNAIGMKNLKKVLGDAGLEALISVPVVHCPQAFGVVLKAAERTNSVIKVIPGWKIVYSGDTRPCPELVEASRGATVLIHEATFEDGMVKEAVAKNHSTIGEAIEVGNSAGAYRIILTHFSQRYPKIPVFDETHMRNTSIAFDLMTVNLVNLHLLPKVLSQLKLLFRNEMEESDDFEDAMTV